MPSFMCQLFLLVAMLFIGQVLCLVESHSQEPSHILVKLRDFKEKILKPLNEKCSNEENYDATAENAPFTLHGNLCGTVNALEEKFEGVINKMEENENEVEEILVEICEQISKQEVKLFEHYTSQIHQSWTKQMKLKVNKMVDYDLEKALMELVEKLSKKEIVNVKLATAEMLYMDSIRPSNGGNRMGLTGMEEKLQWAMQQFAIDLLLVYGKEPEMKELVQGVTGKWPIGNLIIKEALISKSCIESMESGNVEKMDIIGKMMDFHGKILKPLGEKCSSRHNIDNNNDGNGPFTFRGNLCSTVNALGQMFEEAIKMNKKTLKNEKIVSEICDRIAQQEMALYKHYTIRMRTEMITNKVDKMNVKELEGALMEGIERLVGEKIRSKKTAFAEMLYMDWTRPKRGNGEGFTKAEDKLEWAMQQFAVDLLIYGEEIESKELVKVLTDKWTIRKFIV